MWVQIPQGSLGHDFKIKRKEMSTLLYKYTQEFISNSSPEVLIDREFIIKYEKGGDLNMGTKAKILTKKEGDRYLVECLSGRMRLNKYIAVKEEMEFIPVTTEEFSVATKEFEEQQKEFEEQIECMKELGIDQIEKSSFTAWKIFKACKEEEDQEKLKKLIVDSISAISKKE